MHRITLALCSCSGLATLLLLMGQPVSANPATSNSVGFIEISKSPVQTVNPQSTQQEALNESYLDSDKIGDLAVAKLGCDCAGCRATIYQSLQQQLSSN